MIGNLNSIFKQKIKLGGGAPVYDADAQAYFTANTAITSDADKTAINDFYLGLKSDGIYTKITTMYLPLWSSATNNKWNLVNPQDTNGAYRLTFTTGWTHASSGMTPNGTSAYANTFLLSNTFSSNVHVSFYSGTFTVGGSFDMGCSDGSTTTLSNRPAVNSGLGGTTPVNYTTTTDARGFWIGSKRSNTDREVYRNGASQNTLLTNIANAFPNLNIWLSGLNNNNSLSFPSSKQIRFSSIGLGLTDTEATNFSNRVNTLMSYFGINTYPVVSDSDAQAYINANEAIISQSDANAINTFFTGLKSDGIYTKIKAMYLPIWGSASSSKWNLVNPVDTDSAFRLSFSTGFTHTTSGTSGNGTSAYANTNFVASSNLSLYDSHQAFYSRTTGNPATTQVFMGNNSNINIFNNKAQWNLSYTNVGNVNAIQHSTAATTDYAIITGETSRAGFWINNRTSATATTLKLWKNGVAIANATTQATSQILNTSSAYVWARRNTVLSSPQAEFFSDAQSSFISIGTGLTDSESNNFYNRVQTLMTYFGIQV